MTSDELAREAAQIAEGRRMAEFLDDPVVKGAFEALDRRYFAEWKSKAPDPDLWAKCRVIDDVRQELRVVIDSGTLAHATRNKRERASSRTT